MSEVILIGGSPMSGKSAIATIIASKIKCNCISTDDIGEILQTVSDINPMKNKNYLDYYQLTDKADLINDIKTYHQKMEASINKLIEIHSTWGSKILIEGWALYPSLIKKFDKNIVKRIWLIANEELLKIRFCQNIDFYKNANDKEKVAENYLYRSLWHNDLIYKQCLDESEQFILLNNNENKEDLAKRIMETLNL